MTFYSDQHHAMAHSFTELENFCRFHTSDAQLGSINALAFLLATAGVETSSVENQPANNVCRFEYSYSRNSIAFKRSELLRAGYAKWGDLCAMSFGPWQILWIVAAELGYSGHPMDLWNAAESLPYVIKKMNQNYSKGADTPEKLAASWNAGLGALKDKDRWPDKYVQKVLRFYKPMALHYTK